MATTIRLDKNTKKRLQKILMGPFKKTRQFWSALALMIDRDTMLTFRHEGARAGHAPWRPFSADTLQTKYGTWNIRYGTDLSGREKGTYKPFKKRSGIRRYGPRSKLLQASGGFRNSFKIRKVTTNRLIYGTNHELAVDIMSLKGGSSMMRREVLFITPQDEQRYAAQFKTWYLKGLLV